MQNFISLNLSNESLLEVTVHNCCALRKAQGVNLKPFFQILNAVSMSKLNWESDLNLSGNLTFKNSFEVYYHRMLRIYISTSAPISKTQAIMH